MKKVIIILIVIILLITVFFPVIPFIKKVNQNCGINGLNYPCPPKHEIRFTSLVDLLGIGPIRAK